MKKSRGWLIILVIGVLAGLAIIFRGGNWDGKKDSKIGIIDNNGLKIINVSPSRKMTSVLSVKGQAEIWIPEGLGWYQADKIKRVLIQEGKTNLAEKIFFYNFGFIPDNIWEGDNLEDWENDRNLATRLGVIDWLLFRRQTLAMVVNEIEVTNNLDDQLELLSVTIPRDLADMDWWEGNEDVRVGVFNASQQNNLAQFIATRIEWLGVNVTTIENSDEVVNGCLMVTNNDDQNRLAIRLSFTELFGCEEKFDTDMDVNEINLYFGEGYVSMLKYSNYVRSF